MPVNSDFEPERIWKIERDDGSGSTPIIAAAIHVGHEMRPEIENQTTLADDDELKHPFALGILLGVGREYSRPAETPFSMCEFLHH